MSVSFAMVEINAQECRGRRPPSPERRFAPGRVLLGSAFPWLPWLRHTAPCGPWRTILGTSSSPRGGALWNRGDARTAASTGTPAALCGPTANTPTTRQRRQHRHNTKTIADTVRTSLHLVSVTPSASTAIRTRSASGATCMHERACPTHYTPRNVNKYLSNIAGNLSNTRMPNRRTICPDHCAQMRCCMAARQLARHARLLLTGCCLASVFTCVGCRFRSMLSATVAMWATSRSSSSACTLCLYLSHIHGDVNLCSPRTV